MDVVGEDTQLYFILSHGRQCNTLNRNYRLPADEDEIRRSTYHNRMIKILFNERNYIGPVRQALQFGQQRRILDLGTGGGDWAIEMADEFPRAEVIGVDLAPIQPRDVPPNCTFELCDLDDPNIPYPDNHFDLVHARSIHIGIRDYPRFLEEIARILRPGGLVLLIEPSLHPFVLLHPSFAPPAASVPPPPPDEPNAASSVPTSPIITADSPSPTSVPESPLSSAATPTTPITPTISLPTLPPSPPSVLLDPIPLPENLHGGWETLWQTYQSCLRHAGIDVTVPERLGELVHETGEFESVEIKVGNVPIGFWPPETDEVARGIGELQWLDYGLLLPALRSFFLSFDLAESYVDNIIQAAQRDIYEPTPDISRIARLHIVYANKLL